MGATAINGTGNALNNTLTGNAVANILTGGMGTDMLVGGLGNDTYSLARGDGADTIVENDTTAANKDTVLFGTTIAKDQLWFTHVGNNLEVSIIGTADKMVVQDWYSGSAFHAEQIKTSDGKVLLDTKVENLVTAMASITPPALGQTTLTAEQHTALDGVIAANWS
jgi:Ca2+-binding RTX toxin-like protein